jgi:NAD(P)-dependent dehydrogenase (short-subunit alcohol dehydrogenase family)
MQADAVRAIVTGGASGLGLATARQLVAQGGHAVICDLDQTRGEAAAAELNRDHRLPRAHFVRGDVSDEAAATAAVAAAEAWLGGLNVLVNCAGILGAGRVLGKDGPMPLSLFETTVRVNLVGSFNMAKAAAARMQHAPTGADGERGVIVHTASVAAFEGQIGQAAYSASKGGVVGMTLPMARELARFGIRVMTIAPGVFWTPMVDGMPEAVQQSLAASIPFPSRLGQPQEYAALVSCILANTYLNGETIRLDGATRLAAK